MTVRRVPNDPALTQAIGTAAVPPAGDTSGPDVAGPDAPRTGGAGTDETMIRPLPANDGAGPRENTSTMALHAVPGAGGANRDGDPPANAVVLELTGVSGSFDGGETAFSLPVDSGSAVANAVQVRVEYDFDGDGTVDRTETYPYFATNDVNGWESYTQGSGPSSASGSFADLDGGTVRLRIWSALGTAESGVRTGADGGATLTVPFGG
jgi:hypothetical protein